MGDVFFTADTHFGDDRIRRYENRPFDSTQQMDRALIEAWNRVVGEDDLVYHLGDFGADGYEQEILHQLKGKKFLVKGNHDVHSCEYYRNAGFAEVYDLPILYQNFWILSHEPVYVNTNMPYANLFGHVHANPICNDFSAQHVCVCVERTSYAPISFEQIKDLIHNAQEMG